MVVFLSIPMRGIPKHIFELQKKQAEEDARVAFNDSITIINGASDTLFSPKRGDVTCLGEAIKRLAEVDVAFFASGWENARGCRIEHMVCELYGIPYVEKMEESVVAIEENKKEVEA